MKNKYIYRLELLKDKGNVMNSCYTLNNLRMIESKINEIIEYLNNQKQSLSSLYGIPLIDYIKEDYIKKEDLKKYLEALKDEADKENKGYYLIELNNLILINNGMKNCCDYIIKKFSL